MLLRKLAMLYEDQELCDLELRVGSKIFQVHKLILCMSSDVFRVMLTHAEWPESQHGSISLMEEPVCVAVFERFIRFLYLGTISLSHTDVLPILMLADKYNVVDLREICTQYMMNHVVTTIRQNHAVSWYQYARLCGHGELASICLDFISYNFHKVICTEDFMELEKENLVEFLLNSELVIRDEFTLYQGAVRWLNNHETKMYGSPEEFKKLVIEVLSGIRFPLMPAEHLKQLQGDPLTNVFHDFFMEKVTNAFRFHSSAPEERSMLATVAGGYDQFTPRNYTSDTWGTLFAIENFCSLGQHEVRPLFFSSPISASEADENKCWEWHVDVYPKGVLFQKCILIGFWRNLEICGTLYNTVRLTIEAMSPNRRTVDLSVLVTGVQDGIEYIRKVVQKRCCFDDQSHMYNVNDLVPYEELNCPNSPYLSGPDGNTFKITIVIKPVYDGMNS